MSRRLVLACLLPALFLAGCAPGGDSARTLPLEIVPWPRAVRPGAGVLRLPGWVSIGVGSRDRDDRFAADLLKHELETTGGVRAGVQGGPHGKIVLARVRDDGSLGEEGYRLTVTRHHARVEAATAAGIFYGVQTLRQMIHPRAIATAEIEDAPALRWRGVQLDVSRGPIPTLAALERRVATLAEYKVNLIVLYLEDSFAYRGHPVLTSPGAAITPEELGALAVFAARHHVGVVPEQQTFGHLHAVLGQEMYRDLGEVPYGSVLAPVNLSSYALVKSFYDELAPLCPGPFFHVGGDEPRELSVGQSHALAEKVGRAGLYLTHMLRVRQALAEHHRQLLFWSDVLVSLPQLLGDIPTDMIPMSWNYDRADHLEPWIEPFRQARRPFFVCPGISNWNCIYPDLEVALPNIRAFTRAGQEAGAIGQLDCTWDDNGDALFGLCWYPVLYGAAAAWQQGDCDPVRFRRAFDWAFFRSDGGQIADAIERIAAAHKLARMGGAARAGIELTWLDPYDARDRRTLGPLVRPAFAMRRAAESAIMLLEQARPGARRNADQLDYLEFAARRIHYVGFKAIVAWRGRETYLQGQAWNPSSGAGLPPPVCLDRLAEMTGDGGMACSELRAEYERLWLAENKPYDLDSMDARFLRDKLMWLARGQAFGDLAADLPRGGRLPSLEGYGLTALPAGPAPGAAAAASPEAPTLAAASH